MERKEQLIIEDAKIIFRNFGGRETQFNHEGDRNFCVVLEDEELINKLAADGWNVKIRQPKVEGDTPFNYMKVNVSYRVRPPKVYMVFERTNRKVLLNEETVGQLDYSDILGADLVINPRHWDSGNNSGISAYLSSAYIKVDEDPLAQKYSDFD